MIENNWINGCSNKYKSVDVDASTIYNDYDFGVYFLEYSNIDKYSKYYYNYAKDGIECERIKQFFIESYPYLKELSDEFTKNINENEKVLTKKTHNPL